MVPAVADHDQTFGIRAVTRLTGLSAPRLRQWERRYQLVRPLRLANGYRAYTGEQVAFLRAVARLLAAGHEIGDLVGQPRAELMIEAGTGFAVPAISAVPA
jgi:MerR family transcriptional regulator, light-induced transcriptional regulator